MPARFACRLRFAPNAKIDCTCELRRPNHRHRSIIESQCDNLLLLLLIKTVFSKKLVCLCTIIEDKKTLPGENGASLFSPLGRENMKIHKFIRADSAGEASGAFCFLAH